MSSKVRVELALKSNAPVERTIQVLCGRRGSASSQAKRALRCVVEAFGESDVLPRFCSELLARIEERVRVGAHQQNIAAGFDGEDRGLGDAVHFRDGFHLQVIADDDALVPHVAPKKSANNVGRERRRSVCIELGENHMGRHERGEVESLPKGRKLHSFEARERVLHRGKGEVTVDERVAMSGEVLPAAQDPGVCQSGGECPGVNHDRLGRRSKRAIADHGVVWVRVYIEHWGKIHRQPDRPELASEEGSGPLCERRIASMSQVPHWGELYDRTFKPRDSSALLVDGEEGRALFRPLNCSDNCM